jgi:hypothetical protein
LVLMKNVEKFAHRFFIETPTLHTHDCVWEKGSKQTDQRERERESKREREREILQKVEHRVLKKSLLTVLLFGKCFFQLSYNSSIQQRITIIIAIRTMFSLSFFLSILTHFSLS